MELLLLIVGDIRVFAFSAGLSVSSVADEIEFTVFAGIDIDIIVAPGIFRNGRFDIGSRPLCVLIDIFHECAETGRGVRIAADVQAEACDGILQKFELGFCRADISLLNIVQVQRSRDTTSMSVKLILLLILLFIFWVLLD